MSTTLAAFFFFFAIPVPLVWIVGAPRAAHYTPLRSLILTRAGAPVKQSGGHGTSADAADRALHCRGGADAAGCRTRVADCLWTQTTRRRNSPCACLSFARASLRVE